MKKHLPALLTALALLALTLLEGTAMADTIHYYRGENIGDVHPYYDADTQTWIMYYLRANGSFDAAALRSADLLHWEPAQLSCQGALAPYFVLGVQPYQEQYYSWYGSAASMSASRSADLLHWENPGREASIPMGYTTFVGMRDPYVFFDEDAGVWRVICTAYRTNQLQGQGLGMKCALATACSAGSAPEQWHPIDTTLVAYPDGLHGEPECPQMMKIGNRWYIFVSLARRHENHVGRLSYYIGDAGKGILEQDWDEKEEYFLTSEDLCAAQLAQGPDGLYCWGWIAPNWDGGSWGGHLSLPLRVTQNADGTLSASLAPQAGQALRGELLAQGSDAVSGDFDRFDAEFTFTLKAGERAVIHCGNGQITLDDRAGLFAVSQDDTLTHVSHPLTPGTLVGNHTVRVIAEEDMIEAFLDRQYALAARMRQETRCQSMSVAGAENPCVAVYVLRLPEAQPL